MKARPAAIAFIFVTVMLDMLALGLIAPVSAEIDSRFLAWRYEFGRKLEWRFRHGFRADAIFLFAGPRRFVGPLRTTTSDLAIKSWSRP